MGAELQCKSDQNYSCIFVALSHHNLPELQQSGPFLAELGSVQYTRHPAAGAGVAKVVQTEN